MPAVDFKASRPTGSGQVLRGEIESLCSDFALRLSAEVGRAAASTLARTEKAAVAETARTLEQVAAAMRKIRAADRAASVLTALVDVLPAFCRRVVLLLRTGGRMIAFRSAGSDERPGLSEGEQLSFELASAPAIARAVESRSTVTATGAQGDISTRLATELAYVEEDVVRVVPMSLRKTVIGVLIVDGPPIQDPAIETLVLAVEAWIEALGTRPGFREDRATDLG